MGVLFSTRQITAYISDTQNIKRISATLREEYQKGVQTDSIPTPRPDVDLNTMTLPTVNDPSDMLTRPDPQANQGRTMLSATLPPAVYPNNPSFKIQPRFQKLQRRNKDIIAWLTIEDVLDEAVVKRDNAYYLNRDYLGYHNINGALFMDEKCDLKKPPYALIIYGHNMKTGEMFGNLAHYNRLSYYKAHSFITLDTMFEDGQYVIFAVANVGIYQETGQFVNVFQLPGGSRDDRARSIERLMHFSLFSSAVDVQAEDQLLFLVTCTKNDNERLVVAARRIRPDESKENLTRQLRSLYKK